MRLRLGLLCSLLLALSACGLTPEGDALRSTIADRGREAAQAGLENAEWYICRASPVGAIRDRYGAAPEKAQAWKTLCNANEINVIEGR